MVFYRGFDTKYNNYGSRGSYNWITNSIFYATDFAIRNKGKVVKFDLEMSQLKVCPIDMGSVPGEGDIETALEFGYNCFRRTLGTDTMNRTIYGWCVFDRQLLSDGELIMDCRFK